MIRVLVWNEYTHEKTEDNVKKIYPFGMHKAIAEFLKCDDIEVKTATLDDEECGLTEEALSNTDVLIWWGHMAHSAVPDEIAMRVRDAVLDGMGIILLHSSHHSKPFRLLLGTTGHLSWRGEDFERVWICKPSHPIAQGLGRYFELPQEEVYAEPFDIPEPDQVVFMGWYEGGELFRSGCCYNRGYGKIFYFQPGHESVPTFHDKNIQTVIKNAVRWANPTYREHIECPQVERIDKQYNI